MINKLEACPKCGHDTFYRKGRVTGHYQFLYRFDNVETENGGVHDGLKYQESKQCYCEMCHTPLGKIEIPDRPTPAY